MPQKFKTSPQQILEGPILKTLIRLSIPIMVAFVFHTGFNFVDRFFVSRLGEIPFAALGMAFTVQMVMISIGSGLGVGASSLIARLIGAKKVELAHRAADQALFLVLVLSVIFTIGGPLAIRRFFLAIGASDAVLPHVLAYTRIILFGAFFQFFAMIGNGMLRGEGDTVTPMLMMTLGTIVNIILDPLLIFGLGPFPRMGVEGAALATVIARAVSCLILIVSYTARRNVVKPTFKIFRLERTLLVGITLVGGPAVMAQILQPISMSLLFFLLKTYGDASKAALTMGITYHQVAILPVIGLGAGALTMAGQNYGAKRFERLKGITVRANITSAGLLIVMAVIFILSSASLAQVFSKAPEVISIGTNLLIIFSLSLPFVGCRILIASILQGFGMGFSSLVLNGSQVAFAIPLAWFFSRLIGLNGIWWGLTTGNVIAAVVGTLWIWKKLTMLDKLPVEPSGL